MTMMWSASASLKAIETFSYLNIDGVMFMLNLMMVFLILIFLILMNDDDSDNEDDGNHSKS